jgi:hypothetical protein
MQAKCFGPPHCPQCAAEQAYKDAMAFPRAENLSDEVQRLREENARLQCEVEFYKNDAEATTTALDECVEENEKLKADVARYSDSLVTSARKRNELLTQVAMLQVDLGATQSELKRAREATDAAYTERNKCVALIARMALKLGCEVALTRTAIEGWDPAWHGCLYIQLPTGQVSWHYHTREGYLFLGLPVRGAVWDGHDTPEKYRRVFDAYRDFHTPPKSR